MKIGHRTVVVVTGASGGVGREPSESLASEARKSFCSHAEKTGWPARSETWNPGRAGAGDPHGRQPLRPGGGRRGTSRARVRTDRPVGK